MFDRRLCPRAGLLEVYGPACVVTRAENESVLRVELRQAVPIEQLLSPRDETRLEPVISELSLYEPQQPGRSGAKSDPRPRPVFLLDETEQAWQWVTDHAEDLWSMWRPLIGELMDGGRRGSCTSRPRRTRRRTGGRDAV